MEPRRLSLVVVRWPAAAGPGPGRIAEGIMRQFMDIYYAWRPMSASSSSASATPSGTTIIDSLVPIPKAAFVHYCSIPIVNTSHYGSGDGPPPHDECISHASRALIEFRNKPSLERGVVWGISHWVSMACLGMASRMNGRSRMALLYERGLELWRWRFRRKLNALNWISEPVGTYLEASLWLLLRLFPIHSNSTV